MVGEKLGDTVGFILGLIVGASEGDSVGCVLGLKATEKDY